MSRASGNGQGRKHRKVNKVSKHTVIECDNCSAARRGKNYLALWRTLAAEGWETDRLGERHLCPVCVRIREKRQEKKSDGQEKGN